MGQKTNSSAFRAGVNNLWKLDSNIYDQARSNNFSLYSYFFIKKKIKQYKSKIVHFRSQYGSSISFFITIYKFLKKKQKKLKWWERKKLFEKKLNKKVNVKSKKKLNKKLSFKNRIISRLGLKKKMKLKNIVILKLLIKEKKINLKPNNFLKIQKLNILTNFFFLNFLKKYNNNKKLHILNKTKIINSYKWEFLNIYYKKRFKKVIFKKKQIKLKLHFKYLKNKIFNFLKKKANLKVKKNNKIFNFNKISSNKLKSAKFLKVNLQSKRKINKNQSKNLLKFIKVKIKLQKELENLFKKSVSLKLQNVFWKLPKQCLTKIKSIKDKLSKFRSFRGLKDLINIITISSYFFTPELFSDFIACEIETSKKQKFLIKILSFSLKNAFPVLKILKGVKFIIWGKVEKSKRTRKFISKWGRVNTTNLSFQTDEALTHCFTKYGVFGVRVIFTKEWSIKKDVNLKLFKKKI